MEKLILCLFMTMAFILASCGLNQNSGDSESETGEILKTKEEATEGDFVYRLVTEKGEYHDSEPVKMYAELEYIGNQEEVVIYHASSPFSFDIVEKTRGYNIPTIMAQPLLSTTLKKGQPLRDEYARSGAYGAQDDEDYVEFIKDFLKNGFTIGFYSVNGYADFYVENASNNKEDYYIEGQIEFKVEEGD